MSDKEISKETELRARRLIWYLGYFARGNIHIYSEEGQEITEIDVLGVRFDEILHPNYMIIETKSGYEKGFTSILKLKGFQEYFPPSTVSIMRYDITPDIIKFAGSIGIRGYHLSRIDEMEEDLGIERELWFGSFRIESIPEIDSHISLLRKAKGGYLDPYFNFWNTRDAFYKIKVLVNTIELLSNKLDEIDESSIIKAVQWLILEYITLFSVSALEAASDLYSLPSHQRKRIFLTKLISGKLAEKEKEELISNTYKFFDEYSRVVMRRRPNLKRSDLMLVPPYADDLYNMISNIIKNSKASRFMPRYLDLYTNEYFLRGKKIAWEELHKYTLVPDEYRLLSLKASRDVIKFLFPKKIPYFISSEYFSE